jgi:hypothetical protein
LDLASVNQDPITLSEDWISGRDLGISGNLASEWEHYRDNLNEAGVSLNEKEDTLIWTGGDSSGKMSVKNIYATLISTFRVATVEWLEKQTLEMGSSIEEKTIYLDGY